MKQILCIIAIMFYQYSLFSQKISTQEAREDFRIFETAIKEAHPGIYRFETKAKFDSLFQQTENKLIDSIDQQQFYQILSSIIAKIHCGHTKFHPAAIYDEEHLYHYYYGTEHLFPLKLYFYNKKAYFVDSYGPKVNISRGSEIISINDYSIDDLIKILFSNIVADGNVESSKYLELNSFFSAYYGNLIESPQEYLLKLKNADGKIITTKIPSVSLTEIRNYEKHKIQISEANFKISFPKEKVALMRIKAFYPIQKGDNFNSFLKTAFEEIHKKEIQKLIIDLRDNEGGNDKWGALLFSYLTNQPFNYYSSLRIPSKSYSFKKYAQLPKFYGLYKLLIKKDTANGFLWKKHSNLRIQFPQKHPFLGEIIVIVNGFSFSVTSEFAAVAKASRRVKIVGQETGGTYSGNNSGTFVIVTLPHSQLSIGIPMVGYYMAVPAIQPLDRGVLPDLEIIPNIQQIIEGEDAILKSILESN